MLLRRYSKLCEIEDFQDPALRAKLREMARPQRSPAHELHRKYWEYAMLGLYLEEAGALDERARVLSVGAGSEEPLFWLANRVAEVVATDTYGTGAFAGAEGSAAMLANPAGLAPYPYRRDHLEVRSMDARELQFADASFDVVYSLSSIEHFGTPADIRRAAREMARVTRPGGHLVIATEVLLSNHPLDWRPVQVLVRALTAGRRAGSATLRRRAVDGFRPRELERHVILPVGFPLVQPLDLGISDRTRATTLRFDGTDPRTTAGQPAPIVVLRAHGAPWTSVFLPFAKPRPASVDASPSAQARAARGSRGRTR
jgi:SAM-dependent methyltransferase